MKLEEIRQARTQMLGKAIYWYPEIDSTQQEAKRNLLKLENGSLILADYQTKGRGTKQRSWQSSKGKNIMMTLVIYPKQETTMDRIANFTIQIAEILKQVLEEQIGVTIQLKEPNDLMIEGKKIAGILTESATYQNKLKYLFVGIGIDVNETGFSEELSSIATSLKMVCGKELQRESILIAYLEKLELYLKTKGIW